MSGLNVEAHTFAACKAKERAVYAKKRPLTLGGFIGRAGFLLIGRPRKKSTAVTAATTSSAMLSCSFLYADQQDVLDCFCN
jgi:hypothetical protein